MNIASASSRCCVGSGPPWASDRLPLSSIVSPGALCALVVGFVHPASGRTIFHLATSVSIPLFEVELAAFAHAVGASPTKQIVLVLDRAGWHTSVHLRVPAHVHLLFLPPYSPYSPELQPAEHLWPLTNSCLINRHFDTIEDLENAQFARCADLQRHPKLIRSTTRFHWWPQRIRKRQGPRLR